MTIIDAGHDPGPPVDTPHAATEERAPIRRFLPILLVVLLLIVALAVAAGSVFRGNGGQQAYSVSSDGVKKAAATINGSLGHVQVSGGASGGKAVEASIANSTSAPSWASSLEGGLLTLTVGAHAGSGSRATYVTTAWTIRFADRLPVDLRVNGGIGSTALDLRRVDVSSLDFNGGLGALDLDLRRTWTKSPEISLHGGIGAITIHVPTSVGVVVHVREGLGSMHVSGLVERNGDFVNAAYGRSGITLGVSIDQGIGSLNLTTG